MPRSMYSPILALRPEKVLTMPTLTVCAGAGTAASASPIPAADASQNILLRICSSPIALDPGSPGRRRPKVNNKFRPDAQQNRSPPGPPPPPQMFRQACRARMRLLTPRRSRIIDQARSNLPARDVPKAPAPDRRRPAELHEDRAALPCAAPGGGLGGDADRAYRPALRLQHVRGVLRRPRPARAARQSRGRQ